MKGDVNLSGAKNVALKAIIGALLFEGKVFLENVPRINDVEELLHLIRKLGVQAEFISPNTLEIDPSTLNTHEIDLLHASNTRVSFMLFAPLLNKFSVCEIPNPGGCRIGARPIDRIVEGMIALGAEIVYNSETGYYEAKLEKKPRGVYRFQKPSHTGTELLILFSIFSDDEVVIENAALEPEIDELIIFLNDAGARIERSGKTIYIDGVNKLRQQKPFQIVADSNEAATFAVLAIATRGNIVVKNPPIHHLNEFIKKLKETGSKVEHLKDGGIRFSHNAKLLPVSIETAPHPGFKTDWQPSWAVLMTQVKGESYIHERVFEGRFSYVTELQKLGAHVVFVPTQVENPEEFYDFHFEKGKGYKQKIKIIGGMPLHGGVMTIWDLRAGATLVTAALIAKGDSIVNGASILERGYEDFVEKIKKLGGMIKKL